MLPQAFQNALVLTGPTGSGKSELGVEIAERLDAEIISMDSMALYRGMDIGTAKPTPDLRQRIGHHLVDVLDPWQSASVAWWWRQAAACVADIEDRGKSVLFVGGTPLYLKALLRGLFQGPAADAELRRRLWDEVETAGTLALHDRLAKVDSITAQRVHPNDLRRIVRALEVWELTGKPISSWQVEWRSGRKTVPGDSGAQTFPRVLWLDRPRSELYARIDARVQHMFAAGLVEEARGLRQLPQPLSREASQALGYKEVFAYLDDACSLEETIAQIQTRSRNFAKRQLTWFRHLPECFPVTRELTFAAWGLTMDRRSQI
jgi:tRNA dimethylallyltransferase